MLNVVLERLPRADAAACIDTLERDELAALMDALSSAGVATGTGGNLLLEAAARHMRGMTKGANIVHVEREVCGEPLGEQYCVRKPEHKGPCCLFPVEGERAVG